MSHARSVLFAALVSLGGCATNDSAHDFDSGGYPHSAPDTGADSASPDGGAADVAAETALYDHTGNDDGSSMCGATNALCCQGSTCNDPGDRCIKGYCESTEGGAGDDSGGQCGQTQEPCCQGSKCSDPNDQCVMGICVGQPPSDGGQGQCGDIKQPCCMNGVCNQPYSCLNGICS